MASNNCLTNTSVFTSTGAVGDVCSGRGQCVNNACVCDPYWTGRADIFSLDGLACQNPIILDKVLYSFATAVMVLFLARMVPVGLHQVHLYRTQKRPNTGLVFAIVTCAFVIAPAFVAMLFYRTITDEVFAVDPVVSYMYAFLLPAELGCSLFVNLTLLQHLVFGTQEMNQHASAVALIRFHRRSVFFITALYSVAHALYLILGCYVEVGVTWQRITLVIWRSVTVPLYFGLLHMHERVTRKHIQKLLQSGMVREHEKGLKRSLEDVDSAIARSGRLVIFLTIFLGIFSVVPQLYSFNYVPVVVTLALSHGSSHPILRFAGRKHGSSSANKDSSSKGAEGGKAGEVAPTAVTVHGHESTRQSTEESAVVTSPSQTAHTSFRS